MCHHTGRFTIFRRGETKKTTKNDPTRERTLRDAFRTMDADRAEEIRAAYFKAAEGLRALADTLDMADAENPGSANEHLIGEHRLACEVIVIMCKSLLGRIL